MTHPAGDAPAGTAANPVPRLAARVLLLDATGRVLLFQGFNPSEPERLYWFTVGGGLDEGETFAEGAVRELAEETGLCVAVADLVGPIWHQRVDIPFEGVWYRQEQEFFVVQVDTWEVEVAGFDEEERRSIRSHRWWTAAELAAATAAAAVDPTAEKIYPYELAELIRSVAAPGVATIDRPSVGGG